MTKKERKKEKGRKKKDKKKTPMINFIMGKRIELSQKKNSNDQVNHLRVIFHETSNTYDNGRGIFICFVN